MNKKLSTPAASVAAGKVPAPVRVRLIVIRPYPIHRTGKLANDGSA